ncbi:MAG TPA: polysaccharide biosynthesis tyrosine autokinase [Acidisoma sp.]|uniref:GumC family protein n=1 Tax=Acidisoma sp. TaxID=1872115 RepID=UPI002C5F9A72|nr:polysaccharide biosynthesis tyrosine autokinase [Acidisoma sp.]HTH99761.1 polysaccharide biosynthesis tyrosine autokinase [Acidisoma sp.]
MHDEEFHRPSIALTARGHAALPGPAVDPSFGIEPIAVPFGRLMSILRRRLWIILLALAVVVGGAFYVVDRMPKLYTSQASLIIEPQRTQVSDLQAISNDAEDIASLMRTQIDILSSPSLALGVVRALNLTHDPDFVLHGGGLSAEAKTFLADHHIIPPPDNQPLSQSNKEIIASAILGRKISFSNEPHSRLLGIAVTTRDPVLSARIANEFAKQFLAFKVQEKYAAMQRAHDWLQGQVASLAGEVRQKDDAVEAYRVAHGLAESTPTSDNGNGPQPQTINRQQLDATSAELVQVSRDLTEKEGALAQAEAAERGHVSPSDLPSVLSSPVIAQLVQDSAAASAHAAELSASLGPANPELRAAQARANLLEARTHTEMGAVARSLAVQVKAAQNQKAALQQQLDQLRGAVGTENAAEIGLNTLESQARATRNLYESFLTRAAQLANVAGIQEPDASLVSSAEPPLGPSSPKRMRILVVAALLATAVGVGIAILLERLRGGFSRPEEIEAMMGVPLIGMLPAVNRRRLLGGGERRAEAAMSAALDRIRGQMHVLGDERPKTLMVTSSLPKEGKSILAARLARNMAAAGWRVLLLECDFCCPSLAGYFGLPDGPGLCEILSAATLGDSRKLIRHPMAQLDVILAGRVRSDSQEMLASPRMLALLADARSRYDVVIMDTPPVLPVADALILGQHVDAALAVVQWEKTPRDAVMNSIRLMQDSRTPLIGIVMTQVDQKKAAKAGGRISYAFRHYEGYHPSRA